MKNSNKTTRPGKAPAKKNTVAKKTTGTVKKSAPKKTSSAKSPKARKPEPKNSSKKPEKTDKQPKKSNATKSEKYDSVGIYAIKNNKIYDPKSSGEHIYVVFCDSKGNILKAVTTTHLIEKEKQKLIRQGRLLPMQFSNIEFPSGVTDSYYTKDMQNKEINVKDPAIKKAKAGITKGQAEKINRFAKNKRR